MAMLNNLSIIVMVLLISMTSSLVTSRTIDEYSPSSAPALSPAELGHDNYLETCAAKLTEKCGEELFSYVFENSNHYTNDCCNKLLSIGESCHNAMTEYSVELPQFKPLASAYLTRSDRIWTVCSLASPEPSPSIDETPKGKFSPLVPPPPQTPTQKLHSAYLESCADKLSEKCGEEIFSFIFEKKNTYSKHCCGKLVALGKECHDDMTEYSVELPQYKPNAAKYLARSEQIYGKCGFSLLAPSPRKSKAQEARMEYLETCADRLTEKCGEEVFSYIFENGKKYSKGCCTKLKTTGKACHNAMTKYSVELPQYKAKASVILSRSNQLWKKCHCA